jgi:hypothetical protein
MGERAGEPFLTCVVSWLPAASTDHRIVIVPVLFLQVKHRDGHFRTFWEDLARILESAAHPDKSDLMTKGREIDELDVNFGLFSSIQTLYSSHFHSIHG